VRPQAVAPALIRDSAPSAPVAPAGGYWSQAWRRLLRNRLAVASLVVVGMIFLVAALAPWVSPHDPTLQDPLNAYAGPSVSHPFGLDGLGRDWLSRLMHGARISLAVGIFAQVVVLSIGLPLGLIAGYRGRWTDSAIMRFTDLVYAFPDLLLIILLRNVLGGSIFMLFLVIGLVNWVDMARLVRGQVLSLREREFVEAARSLGATDRDIMVRHLLPNLMGPLIVVVAFGIPRAVFIEAALSFIGIGVSIGTPSWGSLVQEGNGAIFTHPNLVISASAAIALLMLAFTFLGDGLRDALDPRITVTPRGVEEAQVRATATTVGTAVEERRAA
jgi:oligopeptide transport system permease protein